MIFRRALGYTKRVLRPDAATARFIRHNRTVWTGRAGGRRRPVVLVDCYNLPQSVLPYSYVANALCRRHGARLVGFGMAPLRLRLDMFRVYRSFGLTQYLQPKRRRRDRSRIAQETSRLLGAIRTKRELFDLEVDGVRVGEDVYESYLRRFSAATVDLSDPRLARLFDEAIGYLRYWQRHLDRHDVRALIVCDDCYIESNILCRLAYQRAIPAYMPHISRLVRLDRPNSPYLLFPHYRDLFAALPPDVREAGVALAKERLDKRVGGDQSVIEISLTDVNAFALPDTGDRVLPESDSLKVLICTHCFFDDPHVYGGLLFEDFWEWLCHVARVAATTEHEWYLKTHPNPLPGTEAIIDRLLEQFPHLHLVPSTVSHHQLVREGIDIVLTCYGSVGEEYPLLGVPVLTSGYHPRVAYDFNHNARTLEEYDEKLRRLDEIVRQPVDATDIYEFYFMHHIFSFDDDLILDSYEQFLEGRTRDEIFDSSVYDHFLNGWNEKRHAEIIRCIEEFIESGAHFQYRHGPQALPSSPSAIARNDRQAG